MYVFLFSCPSSCFGSEKCFNIKMIFDKNVPKCFNTGVKLEKYRGKPGTFTEIFEQIVFIVIHKYKITIEV